MQLQDATALHKKLLRHKDRLLLDAFAVATELRPAFLLDYAPTAPVAAVEYLCKALSESLNSNIVAWHWQGCLWVVSHTRLQARLQAILHPLDRESDCEVWALDFCSNGDQNEPLIRPVWQCEVCGQCHVCHCSSFSLHILSQTDPAWYNTLRRNNLALQRLRGTCRSTLDACTSCWASCSSTIEQVPRKLVTWLVVRRGAAATSYAFPPKVFSMGCCRL